MQVKEAMHAGVESVEPDTPVTTIAKKMYDLDIGAVPVCKNGRLVGMITDRDITCRAVAKGADLSKLKAGDVMTKDVVYCRDTEDLQDAIHIMENKQIRRLPAIDKEERMVGMLSLGDVSHAASQQIAGEVIKAVSGHHA
ncbi:hypoxic response protein 1 [bacterium BMS3Bbin10]|nr:hypoxic response protein 1 [bacterium BMS3Bbin10]HDL17376.1 CBS domain-containing protein [Hyphomicrobiales bacterium]